jgi:hypothetical protein
MGKVATNQSQATEELRQSVFETEKSYTHVSFFGLKNF